MRSAGPTVVLFLILLSFGFGAWADADDIIIVPNNHSLSDPVTSHPENGLAAVTQDEDVKVVYDPNEISVSIENRDRAQLLAEVPHQYQTYLASLSNADIETFLAKKKIFIDGISAGLKKLFFSQKKIDVIALNLDHQFYQSAKVITQSNSYGLTYSLYLKGGLGFADSIVEGIRKRNGWTKKISEKSANYMADRFEKTSKLFYLIGLSLAIQRVQDSKTGKHFFILDAFAQLHFLKSIRTFLNFIDYDLAVLGIIAEKRNGNFDKLWPDQDRKFEYETEHLGAVGRVRRSEDMFNFQSTTHVPGLTLSFPPLLPALAFFKDKGKEYRLFSINLTKLSPMGVVDFLKSITSRQPKILQCHKLFSI